MSVSDINAKAHTIKAWESNSPHFKFAILLIIGSKDKQIFDISPAILHIFSEQFEVFLATYIMRNWSMVNYSHTPSLLWSQSYPQCSQAFYSVIYYYTCTWHRQINNLIITYWCFYGNTHPMLLIQAQSGLALKPWANGYLYGNLAQSLSVICGTLWVKMTLWLTKIFGDSPIGSMEKIPAMAKHNENTWSKNLK